MSLPFSKYVEVKDKICIGYFGPADEHLIQIRGLRPNIELKFPDLQVYLSCKDECLDYFKNESRVIPLSRLKEQRREFGIVYEMTRDMESHPVEQFFELSGIPLSIPDVPKEELSKRCVICPDGEPPTKKLSAEQQQILLKMARKRGFRPEFGEDVSGAGWVVGVECVALYEAAFQGVKCSLVPTGVGTGFFKKLLPGYEILKI